MLPNTSLFYYFFFTSLKQAEVHLLYWFLFLWMLKFALQGLVVFCLWQGRKINVNKYQMDHGDIWQKKYEIHPGWTGRDFFRLWRATCRSHISGLWYIYAANMFRLFAVCSSREGFWSLIDVVVGAPAGSVKVRPPRPASRCLCQFVRKLLKTNVSDWNSPVRPQGSWNWQERPGVRWVSLIGSLAATLV